MVELVTKAAVLDRAIDFFADYFAAPDDADIVIRLAAMGIEAVPSIAVSVGEKHHGFTASEARKLATIAENTLHKFPNEDDARGLPNLVLALRHGADQADAVTSVNRPDNDATGENQGG